MAQCVPPFLSWAIAAYVTVRACIANPISVKQELVMVQKDELNRLRDEQGRPPGVMGWWPSRATTFLENHDTVSSQAFCIHCQITQTCVVAEPVCTHNLQAPGVSWLA